jgi:hypothetical protein
MQCEQPILGVRPGKRNYWGPPLSRLRQQRSKRSLWSSPYDFPGPAFPCALDVYEQWLDLPQVREALNVPVNATFFNGDDGEGFVYRSTEPNLLPFYGHVIVYARNCAVCVFALTL